MPILLLAVVLAGQPFPWTQRVEGIAFGTDRTTLNIQVDPEDEVHTYVVWTTMTTATRIRVRGFGVAYPIERSLEGQRVRVRITSTIHEFGYRTEHADLIEVGPVPQPDVGMAYQVESWVADLVPGIAGHPLAGTLPAPWAAQLRDLGSGSYKARTAASTWFARGYPRRGVDASQAVLWARTLVWGMASRDPEVRARCALVLAGVP